jgi:serine protease AprX
MKVLDADGNGTEEEAVLAVDDCISLHETQPEIAPLVINLSLGSPDDGNPNNILRVACRAAIELGILIAAAAGNSGPAPGTIMSPACERYVGAVGSARPEPFTISEFSSRGPTLEGLIKPDAVLFGENIQMASSESDTATTAKSGTSFAAPFGSGIILVCQEGIIRQATYPKGVPEGFDPTATRFFTAEELIDKWAPRISVKPQGVALGKDNDYGCGLPVGDLVLSLLQPAIIDVSALLSSVIVIGMLGMMTTTMTKSFRR